MPVIFESSRISAKLLLNDLGISPGWSAGMGRNREIEKMETPQACEV